MVRQVRIDDIPADGAELAEDQLAKVLGGQPGDPAPGTSGTAWVGGWEDTDKDF